MKEVKNTAALKTILSLLCGCSLMTTSAQESERLSAPAQPEIGYTGYLFAYFNGNKVEEEAICYAISTDGYNYRALNGNLPILNSVDISSTGGVRDPHILRCEDGHTFYMVATDMTSSKGWDSNRAMILLKSEDLIHWTHSIVNMQQRYPGQEDLKRVWAPQTIFDPAKRKYMVYWSMKHGDGPDVIHYAYANEDFTDLEGSPQVLFLPKSRKSCIDGDIINKNGLFYLFYKTEGHGNGIKLAITDSLASGRWVEQPGYKQQTPHPVEGSTVFRLNNTDIYILMYDVYTKGEYQFCKSMDLDIFKVIDQDVRMDFHPRHGSVIPLRRAELIALTARWGVPEGFELSGSRK